MASRPADRDRPALSPGWRRWRYIAGTAILAALFLLPLADNLGRIDPAPPLVEKRELAPFPEWIPTVEGALGYSKRFEKFVNDHSGFRRSLIRGGSVAKVFGFHTSPLTTDTLGSKLPDGLTAHGVLALTPLVVVGRDGWLYYGDELTIEDWRGLRGWQYPDLKAWERTIEERRDWFAKRGIKYLFAVAPNKHTIYPEHLPAYVTRVENRTKLDRLMAHLSKRPDLPVLDLRKPLLAARRERLVYHLTDSHWNDDGCLVAYREIMKALAPSPAAEVRIPDDGFDWSMVHRDGGDLAEMMGIQDYFRFDDRQAIPRARYDRDSDIRYVPPSGHKPNVEEWIDAKTSISAVIFRDSFCTPLIKFFSVTFGRTAYYRYEDFSPRIFDHEKPDVVIDLIAERHVANIVLRTPEEMQTTGTEDWTAGRADFTAADAAKVRASRERWNKTKPVF